MKNKWERIAGGYEVNQKTGKVRATSKYGKFGKIHERSLKKSGWFNESQRHSLARKGIRTGRKDYSKTAISYAGISKSSDAMILKQIENTFKDIENNIIQNVKQYGKIQLTYGMVPTFRDWFSPELDEKYMYKLSSEGQEQVHYLVEEMINRLADKDIVVYGDEGDGTVTWAEKTDYANVRFSIREMRYDEKLTRKKAKELADENNVSLDKVREIAEEELR